MENHLEEIEALLEEQRTKWRAGSPAMKRYIEKIAVPPLLKARDSIKKRLERQKNARQ